MHCVIVSSRTVLLMSPYTHNIILLLWQRSDGNHIAVWFIVITYFLCTLEGLSIVLADFWPLLCSLSGEAGGGGISYTEWPRWCIIWTCLTGLQGIMLSSHSCWEGVLMEFLPPPSVLQCELLPFVAEWSCICVHTEQSGDPSYPALSTLLSTVGGCCGRLNLPKAHRDTYTHITSTPTPCSLFSPHHSSVYLSLTPFIWLSLSFPFPWFLLWFSLSWSLSLFPDSLVCPLSCFSAVWAADQGVSGLSGVITDIWAGGKCIFLLSHTNTCTQIHSHRHADLVATQ